MEKRCTFCCGLLWFGKRRSSGGKEAKASSAKAGIVKRISKEHLLLSYSAQEERHHDVHKLQHQFPPPSVADLPLCSAAHYRPPAEMERADDAHGLLLLPLLRAGVKETRHEFRSQDSDGSKMVNEYVRKHNLGTGSYGKVVLHQSKKDEKFYAVKIFHKSRLSKLRVSPTETAMVDVHREVAIMKRLDHPNIVKLYEVIDDPESDRLYLVLEYVEGNWIFEGCGPPGGLGEALARKYFQDAVSGLSYLHSHNVIHRDIKAENLLVSGDGSIKICDFGVSQMFEGGNDELQRSPGTPVYTAPECCSGLYYRGCPADIWALGCTLYCMVFGRYPFVGDTFPSVFDKIVNQPLFVPEGTNPDLADLLRGLLCKDVRQRLPLAAVALHPWLRCSYAAQVQATACHSKSAAYAETRPPPADPFGPPLAHPFVVHGNARAELGSMV